LGLVRILERVSPHHRTRFCRHQAHLNSSFARHEPKSNGASRIGHSASFLFETADLELIDAAIATYTWPGFGELIEEVDKPISDLRKSANQLFRRR
jgi:hypothetical protein